MEEYMAFDRHKRYTWAEREEGIRPIHFLMTVVMKSRILRLLAMALLWPVTHAAAQTPSPSEAQALERQGKLEEAARVWRAVTLRNPTDAAAFASLGSVLSREQKYREAASAYRNALALNPRLPGVQLNLGLAEFKQGHFRAAIRPFSAAVAADPHSLQARTLLGMSYYGTQDFAQAAKHLRIAARADPGSTELHQALAQSCLKAKQYSCAMEEFRQILQKDPDSVAAHVLLGEALDGLDKTSDAVVELQAAAKVAPREPEVHFGLGFLYWKLQRYDEAQRAFEDELAIDADHAQSLAYLGDIEMKKNNSEKAISLLSKAVQLNNQIRIAYLDLGGVFAEQKRYEEALAALRRAVALDPGQADAHYILARVYRAMGDTAASKEEFAKVRDLHQKAEDDLASKVSKSLPQPPP
jgi:tetratricopeptide (TPR) repeat protein